MNRRWRARWRIVLERGALNATLECRGGTLWSGSRAWGGEQEIAGVLRDLIQACPVRPSPKAAEIRVAAPLVQRRTLEGLPPVREGSLRALVSLQSSRFFRQNGHRLVTDAAWLRNGRAAARTAQAVAVDEPLILATLDAASALNLQVDTVGPLEVVAARRFDLLPPTAQATRQKHVRRDIARLSLLVSVLWLSVAALAVTRFVRERHRVDEELARLAGPVTALIAARREMGKAQATLKIAAGTDEDRTVLPLLVRSVARALPDSAFLTTLTMDRSGNGSLAGAARRPLEVVAQLEKTQGIRNPRLEGPTVRDLIGALAWERFTVTVGDTR